MQNEVSVSILEMRRFRKSDISKECPFEPELEDINLSIRSLVEDIESLKDVTEVNVINNANSNNKVSFEIKAYLTFEELKDNIKVYLSDNICYLRFVNLFTKEMFGEIK